MELDKNTPKESLTLTHTVSGNLDVSYIVQQNLRSRTWVRHLYVNQRSIKQFQHAYKHTNLKLRKTPMGSERAAVIPQNANGF